MNFLRSLFSSPLLPLTRHDIAPSRVDADTLLQAAEAGLLDQRVFIQVKGSIN
jgi:hypothetical protein